MEMQFYSVCILLLMHLEPNSGRLLNTSYSHRVVTTQFGKLRGFLIHRPNQDLQQVEAFFGIEYASVLDGELRFMPPTSPMDKWSGIRMAMRHRPVCPQRIPTEQELERKLPEGRIEHLKRLIPFIEKQAEECLTLNIFMPARALNNTERLAVIVFVHGESYEQGTGNAYDGSVLASYGDVIVITLNYRLGPLGFLTTCNSGAPGNLALLDLVAALHWVRGNIRAFGGDPDLVTLMGQGYGGALVNLLLISPITKGKNLFKRAIIQSASALSSWAVTKDPLRYTEELAGKVNCTQPLSQTDSLLQCLKSKSAKDLVDVKLKWLKYYPTFGPYVDKRSILTKGVELLTEKPESVFGETDVLFGVMKNEGFLHFIQDQVNDGIDQYERNKIIRTYVRNLYDYHRQKIFDILVHHYSDHEQPSEPKVIRESLMDMIGDGQIVAPMVKMLRYHANHPANTYFYSFNYPTRTDAYPRWAGGVHGDDLIYVFGAPLTNGIDLFPGPFNKIEKMLSESIMTYWTNFAKSGDPNKPVSQTNTKHKNRFSDISWPKYNNREQEYLYIGSRPSVRHHYRGSKMALWLDLIPKLHRSDNLSNDNHILDNHNNESTFESPGTRQLNDRHIFIPPPIPPTPPPSFLYRHTTKRAVTPKPEPETTTPFRRTKKPAVRPTDNIKTQAKTERTIITRIPTKPRLEAKNSTHIAKPAGSDKGTQLSLSVIVAIGCSLLVLNILVFAGVYYQRDRMKMEMRMKPKDSEQSQSLRSDESEPLKAMYSDQISDHTNSSLTPPPPPIGQMTKQQQANCNPNHPLPIPPPQPPYYARNNSEKNHLLDSPRTRDPRYPRTLSPRHVRLTDTKRSSDIGNEMNTANRDTVV